jgi:hypothetical protein
MFRIVSQTPVLRHLLTFSLSSCLTLKISIFNFSGEIRGEEKRPAVKPPGVGKENYGSKFSIL